MNVGGKLSFSVGEILLLRKINTKTTYISAHDGGLLKVDGNLFWLNSGHPLDWGVGQCCQLRGNNQSDSKGGLGRGFIPAGEGASSN